MCLNKIKKYFHIHSAHERIYIHIDKENTNIESKRAGLIFMFLFYLLGRHLQKIMKSFEASTSNRKIVKKSQRQYL